MKFKKQQIVNALVAEYEYLCHDDFDPAVDVPVEEYRLMVEAMTYDELIEETSSDNLEEYMQIYGTV